MNTCKVVSVCVCACVFVCVSISDESRNRKFYGLALRNVLGFAWVLYILAAGCNVV